MQNSSNPDSRGKNLPQTWPSAGSTSYYALLNCSDAALDNVRCTLDLINSISSVLVNVTEPSVAEQKVHWWHEELARLANGEARHPATKAWFQQQSLQQPSLVRTDQTRTDQASNEQLRVVKPLIPLWLVILSCNANERFSNATDDAGFLQRIEDDYSARIKLLAHALEAGEPSALIAPRTDAPVSNDIVTGLGLCHRLRRFNQLQSGGVMVWPDSLYQQYELQPEHLHDPDKKNQLLDMLGQITEEAVGALTRGLDELSRHSTSLNAASRINDSSIAFLTAATLRLQQMKMWQRNRPDLLRQYQGLTPFRKSLVTWRTRRKLARLQNQT